VWCKHRTWCCGLDMKDEKDEETLTNWRKQFRKGIENRLRELRFPNREKRFNEIAQETLRVIRIYGIRDGIKPYQLSKIMYLDKTNLTPYLEKLERQGKIKRENQQAPYFPTDEFYKDLLLDAYLFTESFGFRFLKVKRELVLTNAIKEEYQKKDPSKIWYYDSIKIDTEFHFLDFTKYKKYYLPQFTEESSTEKNLFELSNRIGAFITRLLIEALSQGNYSPTITDLKEQNVVAQEYINKAISTLIPYLIPAFKELIEKVIMVKEFYETKTENFYVWNCSECRSYAENPDRNDLEEHIRNHQEKTGHVKGKLLEEPIPVHIPLRKEKHASSKFLYDSRITEQLVLAFGNIYPLLDYEFNKIIENLPSNKESYRKFTESLYNKWKQQENCRHNFKEPAMTLYGYYGKQCSKCNQIERVKPPTRKSKS
jgi:hypothetical protein